MLKPSVTARIIWPMLLGHATYFSYHSELLLQPRKQGDDKSNFKTVYTEAAKEKRQLLLLPSRVLVIQIKLGLTR